MSIYIGRVVLAICLLSSCMLAQTGSDQSYADERQKAVALFNEHKELKALPLFEELAAKDPKDADVQMGLGACLVSHSATVTDPEASAKELVRAREVLLKAQELGNHSTLLQNLLQLLPADGKLRYSGGPEDQAMRAGEAAFARRDFPEAIKSYSKALELNPKNYSAALFVGDSYFAANDFTNAAVWYQRAIEVDPNQETAYRYYADMLTKSGEMEKSRKMAIQAVIAEPYNPITWRGLQQWAHTNHVQLNRVSIKVPNSVSQTDEKNIQINIDPKQPEESSSMWMAYSLSKALWRGDKFKQQFPREKQYRHSLAEEADCLNLAATVFLESAQSKKKTLAVPKDPDLATLLRLKQAEMIEPYVLLNAADNGIAQDYAAYREKNRGKLEQYLSEFIVPPAPAK